MTRRRSAAATAVLIGAFCGCAASTEPDSKVTAIVPATAFNDAAFSALIRGESFRPTYRFDTMAAATRTEVGTFSAALTLGDGSAAAAIPLEGVTWQSPTALVATVPAGLPAGRYDVTVTDPRGRLIRLDGGFVSLGTDTQAPVVTIDEPAPGTIIGAGTTVRLALTGDDGYGLLATLGASISTTTMDLTMVACNVPSDTRRIQCHAEFVAPAPADENDRITITPYATDIIPIDAAATSTSFKLAPRPSLTGVSPTVGPASGGTEILVQGTDLVEGTEILFGGQPVKPTSISATEIRALTPNHDPGWTTLKLTTGGAESAQTMYFEFVPAPIIREIAPPHGPVTGGTRIAIGGNYFRGLKTTITIGGTALLCPVFVGTNRIEGVVPPGTTPGPVAVMAEDAIGGPGTAHEIFTYDPAEADAPDGGVDPKTCAGGP